MTHKCIQMRRTNATLVYWHHILLSFHSFEFDGKRCQSMPIEWLEITYLFDCIYLIRLILQLSNLATILSSVTEPNGKNILIVVDNPLS